jgi:hypothetical protein
LSILSLSILSLSILSLSILSLSKGPIPVKRIARSEDDRANLRDLDDADAAVKTASTALRDAMTDPDNGEADRALFVDCAGLALARLTRILARISKEAP